MTQRPPPDLRQIWQEGSVAGLEAKRQALRTRRPRAGRGPPRRRRWLAAAGYGTLGFVCLGLAALAFLLVAAPVDVIRDRLIERVKAQTGRQLVVAGPASLGLFPRLAVSLRDVALSAPDGMTGAPTVAMASLEVELRVWPLLSWQVVVERLTLHQPTIELSVDAQGRRSWDVAIPGTGSPQRAPAGVEGPDQQSRIERSQEVASKATAALASLGVENVRVVDGTLRYRDEGSGSRYEIKALDLALTARDLAGPLEISGTLAWRGVQAGFAGTVAPLRALLADQPAQLVFKVSGPLLEAVYEGTVALSGGIALDGRAGVKGSSARALLDWLGAGAPAGAEGDALAVSAHLKADQGRVALSQLEASLGDTSVAGSLTADTKRQRPHVSGQLQISKVDFGALLMAPSKRARVLDSPTSPQPSSVAPASPAEGKAGRRGWSEDPINVAVLELVDADLTLAAERLVYKEAKTGQSRLAVSLKSGIAKVTLEDIELYDGRGRGTLTLDGTGEALAAAVNLRLFGVSVLPLLTDALGVQWLDGRGNVTLGLTGKGLSERQIVETLSGKVDLAVANGAVTGIDMAKVVGTLQQGRLPRLAPTPEDRTPFSEFSGTFDVIGGTAKNQDLRLVSEHVRLSGEGVLDLGPRQIDYTMRAKVGGGPPAPGAVLKIGSFEIPVAIQGAWEKPSFSIKGQEQLTEALKQIGKSLKSQELQDAIKGMLRGDGEKRTKPRELLEKLLKKKE